MDVLVGRCLEFPTSIQRRAQIKRVGIQKCKTYKNLTGLTLLFGKYALDYH